MAQLNSTTVSPGFTLTPALAERFEILTEQLEILTGLWATPLGGRFTHQGRHYTVTDSDQGVAHCCECSHPGVRANEWDPNSWRPTYPVTALVTEWPDMERVAAEDFIDPWWAPALPAGKTTSAEGGVQS